MFETFADMQKQAAETMQKAMLNGGNVDFNSDIFKKWYENQMSWFNQGMPNMGNMNNDMGNVMNMFNSWKSTMSNTYNEMLNHMNNGTAKNSFGGLYNNAEVFMKMFELMMPLMKTLQDKTYTPDMFKQMFNAPVYKDMMDKMFNMQPDFMKNMMSGMNAEMKNNMGKMMDMNKNMFDNMKSSMTSQFSNMMPNDMFAQGLNQYNNWYNQMNTAMAPLTKLLPSNSTTQAMDTMKEMSNMMAVYNMKNNQLQHMMYTTGLKAMEQFSETLYTKMRNGEEMNSFMPVYNEWLSLHDKNFIALFETEEYSKLMSEVSSLQLNLKKQVDLQMEKAMSNLPIINRTEMDELYKTIYELRKRINTLEKQMDSGDMVSEEPKVAPKKTAKNA